TLRKLCCGSTPQIQIIISTTTTARGGAIILNTAWTSQNTASGCRCKRQVFQQPERSETAGSRKFRGQSYEKHHLCCSSAYLVWKAVELRYDVRRSAKGVQQRQAKKGGCPDERN